MANTTHGYPYPVGTDRLMDGDDSIHSLATAIDTQLGVAASGIGAVPTPTVGATGSLAITFPAGRFNVAPNVVCVAVAANPQNFQTSASGVSTTGATLNVYKSAGATNPTNTAWVAHVI